MIGEGRLNPLMTDDASGVYKTCPNVFTFEPSVAFEDSLGRVARGEHPEYMLHGQTMPSDDRFATEDLWVRRNSRQKLGFAIDCCHRLR